MKKILFVLPAVLLLAAGCNSVGGTSVPTQAANRQPAPSGQTRQSQNTVIYGDSGFSPAVLNVKKGETVTFQNNTSDGVWVASNPHPNHDGYPTTGGCVSSTFDSCANISSGQSWSFKFDIAGSWGFHNHLNPSEGGRIIVK